MKAGKKASYPKQVRAPVDRYPGQILFISDFMSSHKSIDFFNSSETDPFRGIAAKIDAKEVLVCFKD